MPELAQPQETELTKPKMRLALNFSPKKLIQRWIRRVEEPEDLEVKRTFGYRPTPEERRQMSLRRTLAELGAWVVALLIVFGLVNRNWATIKGFLDLATGRNNPVIVEEPAPTPIPSSVTDSMFSGLAYQLGEDLGWVRSDLFSDLTYYYAGEVISGQYTGAHRYFAIGLLITDATLTTYEFWELPDGQVLLNGERLNAQRRLTLLNDYYIRMIFTDKVSMVDQLDGDWPQTLPVSSSMILYRRELLTDLGPYDDYLRGWPRLALSLPSEYYQQLALLESDHHVGLKFYTKMYNGDELYSQISPNVPASDEWVADRYLFGGSKVIVTDRTGVSCVYELVFKNTWESYKATLDSNIMYLDFYQQELANYTATDSFAQYRQKALAGQILALPDGQPRMPVIASGLPGLNFSGSDFEFSGQRAEFDDYTSAYTAVCYPRIDAKVLQNISLDDLRQVGKLFVSQTPVYVLRDEEHGLNRLAYDLKLVNNTIPDAQLKSVYLERFIRMNGYSDDEAMDIRAGEREVDLPEFARYIQAMPLLIIPDPWGRYLLVWENDLDFLADCGIIHAG